MASAESQKIPSANQSTGGLVTSLWNRWQRKRRRDRARLLSQVRFRLTREGVHFIGILIFIFIGAVIRDINLLILLAGSMIGLLLLQWRFNSGTLVGLSVARRLPKSVARERTADIEVTISNPKFWLGAWLVLVNDPVRKLRPVAKRLSVDGHALADSVKPRGSADCKYQLVFHQRGEYQVGPSTISTRFPIGLGIGWRTVDNASTILVHPKLGQLKNGTKGLFDQDRLGGASASHNAGVQEGEFYGLRPWATGDSKRWIHWRTTARLGELSVRQFEQRQQRQISILIDLFDDGTEACQAACESAISFLATLARGSVTQGRDKLAVAVAGQTVDLFTAVQSPVLVSNLLDKLAVTQPSKQPDWLGAFRGLNASLLSNPRLLVVSTRADESASWLRGAEDAIVRRMFGRVRVRWLNVMAGDLEPYFDGLATS